MPNTILTSSVVLRKSMALFHNKSTLIGSIDRQYDNSFAQTGAKVGSQIKIKLPIRAVTRTGMDYDPHSIEEQSVTLGMAKVKGQDFNLTSLDMTLHIDDIAERLLKPEMAQLVSSVEADAFNMYKDIYNQVGTAGTVPATWLVVGQAGAKINQFLAPQDRDRHVVLDSEAMITIINAHIALFNPQAQLSKQFQEALVYERIAGFNWWQNDIIPTHTCGSRVASGESTVNGANQVGSSLIVTGSGTKTYKKGDVFVAAGCYAIHPESRAAYTFLQQFVITEDAACVAGAVTLKISPSIITSGALQTVSASPTTGGAITFTGVASTGYRQALSYHKKALIFATVDLEQPKGVDFASVQNYDGISMSIVRDFDFKTRDFGTRIDILYDYLAARPQAASRITY